MAVTIEQIRREAQMVRFAAEGAGRLLLMDLCSKHNINVQSLRLQGDARGVLIGWPAGWVMIINRRTNRSRQRRQFTIAHELGHYFLHRHLQRFILCRKNDRSRMEWEANAFAAELLMPAIEMVGLYGRRRLRPEDIADHLGVSMSAVRMRLRELELA